MDKLNNFETDQQLQEPLRRLTTLNNLAVDIAAAEDVNELFDVVADRIGDLFQDNQVSLVLTDDQGTTFTLFRLNGPERVWSSGVPFPLEATAVESAITTQQVVNTPDLSNKLSYRDNQKLVGKGLRSTVVAPLVTTKQTLGSLNVGSQQIDAFSALDEQIARQLAHLLATTIENRRLLAQLRHRAAELEKTTEAKLETVADVSTVIATVSKPNEILQLMCDLTQQRFELYHACVYLLDQQELVLAAGAGEKEQQPVSNGRLIPADLEQSPVTQAVSTKQGVMVNDVQQASEYLQNPLLPETRSELAVPMLADGEVIGVLNIHSNKINGFGQEDINIYTILAAEAAGAVKNARLFQNVSQAHAAAENRLQAAETLHNLTEALTGSLRIDEVIGAFFNSCTGMLGFDFALFSLIDKSDLRIKAVAGWNVTDDHIRRANHPLDSDDIMADIVRSGKTEVITGWDPRFDVENFEAEQMAEWGMRVFMPITLRRENIGLIEVGFNEKVSAEVQESHLQLLRSLVGQTAVALESAQRYEASRKAAQREQLLREITARVRGSADVDSVMRTAAHELGKALGRSAFVQLGKQ